jgi:hypothetical protein
MHADHHLGLVRLLVHRQHILNRRAREQRIEKNALDDTHSSVLDRPLFVIGPTALFHWLCEYSEIEHISFSFLSCRELCSATLQSSEGRQWRLAFYFVHIDLLIKIIIDNILKSE